MKNNTNKLNQRLDLAYLVLCCINFIIISFISGVMYICIQRMIDNHSSLYFLEKLSTLPPSPPYQIIVFSIISFGILLCLLQIKKIQELTRFMNVFIYITVISLSMIIMYYTSFANNSILLLVMTNFFVYARFNEKRYLYLFITVIIYMLCNFNLLSFIPMVSFNDYTSFFGSDTQNILNVIMNSLNTISIVLFLLIMVMMILKEVNESRRVLQLNSELQLLNKQLQEYASIQEKMGETKERNRLAREIHDTLGHTLTGLSMGIDASMMLLDDNPEASKKQLERLSKTARQGLTDVRRSVNKLRPDALERHTLKEAIEQMIADFQLLSDIEIRFACHMPTLAFEPDEEDTIYRIIQESITNSVRHGNATKIFVSIALDNNNIILLIEDNGIGSKKIQYGFGLHHMKERIDLLNGTMRVYGLDGFVVVAEIPLRKENMND
ncbi:signal transduction histidine kinase [Breznakia sp. PF5-3]|uniref:sensor histidine kinase n=1 Tax=unclassified Breznakia TaxID=2623764 RepID=UPI0024053316|nr:MULTISPECIES: sensor histidine kinase [unclassified Breznakia]MDF9824861.1 signal transduction histidine kinase [Breznakia sp. PM6-1]MDF9835718.1 signal transduction histidine kinase [Breznakia sp. PF5-3]MDF9838278.1 signal transduction histidine kinase [Breznakia sp. PFB2-8]MDF9860283.1 signal transduction histidine kinase [Breznakia sp. PH5-24]